MRRAPLLLLLSAVSACYPAIPGKWDDYYLPDDVQLIARSLQTRYAGGYWTDPDAVTGSIWWGWLATADPSWTGLQLLTSGDLGCHLSDADYTYILDAMTDPQASTSTLSGPQDLELPWWEDASLFYLDHEGIDTGRYTLDALETGAAGNIQVADLFRQDEAPVLDGPELEGEDIATVALADLTFQWQPEDDGGDLVVVNVFSTRAVEGTYEAIDNIYCAAEYQDGTLQIDESLFSSPSDIDALYLYQGLVHVSHSRVGRRDVSALGVAATQRLGFLWVD